MRTLYFLCIIGLLLSCARPKTLKTVKIPEYREFQKQYLDVTRNRTIPVHYYVPNNYRNEKLPIVIFSHSYGKNHADSNKKYSALLSKIASKGYFVASIQHELPKDILLPTEGDPQVVRRSNWERGGQNILYTYNRLKKDFPKLDYDRVIIAGHSNGGDMSILFTEEHPGFVWKLITLDQKRYPFPHTRYPKIYSIRSSDQLPDEGVLPTEDEQNKFGFKIIKLKKTIHNDMGNGGTEPQKKEIQDYFIQFLED